MKELNFLFKIFINFLSVNIKKIDIKKQINFFIYMKIL